MGQHLQQFGQRLRALVIKEFLALLKDKRSRMVVLVPPLIQLLVFGYAATFDLNRVPYAVYDEDHDAAARDLAARFAGSPHFRQVAVVTDDGQIAPLVDGKRVLLVLHIGPQFSRELRSGRPGPVQVIIDGRNSNTAAILLNYVNTILAAFNADWEWQTGGPGALARLETRAWFNPNLLSRWFIVPGIVGLLTLVVTTLVTALSVAREREHGTFDQLLVTPFRPVEILLGKALPGFLIGFFETTLIIVIATLWFRVPPARQPGDAVRRPVFLPALDGGNGADDLLVVRHSATGVAGRVSVHRAVDHPLRFRHADCQHAALGAADHVA